MHDTRRWALAATRSRSPPVPPTSTTSTRTTSTASTQMEDAAIAARGAAHLTAAIDLDNLTLGT
jgi:hypothetical protein